MPEYLAPGVYIEETSHRRESDPDEVGGLNFGTLGKHDKARDDTEIIHLRGREGDGDSAGGNTGARDGGGFSDVSGLGAEVNFTLPEVEDEVFVLF